MLKNKKVGMKWSPLLGELGRYVEVDIDQTDKSRKVYASDSGWKKKKKGWRSIAIRTWQQGKEKFISSNMKSDALGYDCELIIMKWNGVE